MDEEDYQSVFKIKNYYHAPDRESQTSTVLPHDFFVQILGEPQKIIEELEYDVYIFRNEKSTVFFEFVKYTDNDNVNNTWIVNDGFSDKVVSSLERGMSFEDVLQVDIYANLNIEGDNASTYHITTDGHLYEISYSNNDNSWAIDEVSRIDDIGEEFFELVVSYLEGK